jgi:hypothetical protein
MTFDIVDSILEQADTKTCDAVDCISEPTEKIQVSAGKHGFITLFVCDKCISKFLEDK